jgi:hypothetical protein
MLAQAQPQVAVDPSTGMIKNSVNRQSYSPANTTDVSYSNSTGMAMPCDHNGMQKPMNKQDEAWLFSMNMRAWNNNNGFGNGELPNLLMR